MDQYFPQYSPEHRAHTRIREDIFYDSTIGVTDIGLCAAYAAVERYTTADLYVVPRNERELEAVL